MFEFKIAFKYLLFRRKRFSSSLISLVSIFIISIVVWLILVFLSVIGGIEKNWLSKLTSLNAPVRITPTNKYYNSYYYLIDNYAAASDYSSKTIKEKYLSESSDPYNFEEDMELPSNFPAPDLKNNKLIDPIKSLYSILENKKSSKNTAITYQDYEISAALMRLTLNRAQNDDTNFKNETVSFLTQMSYLLSLNDKNPKFTSLVLPPTNEDIFQICSQLEKTYDDEKKDIPQYPKFVDETTFNKRLKSFFQNIDIEKVSIDKTLLKSIASSFSKKALKKYIIFDASLDFYSIRNATSLKDVQLNITTKYKKNKIDTKIPFLKANISKVKINKASTNNSPLYSFDKENKIVLPTLGDKSGVLLPKTYKKSGVLIGDRGFLSYASMTLNSNQEQRVPIFVSGFYDPGVLPIGNKCIIVPPDITKTINASSKSYTFDGSSNNGVYLWTKDLKKADQIKDELEAEMEKQNISAFFDISTYKDFEFSRDLLQQFQSDRTLFTLIAIIILLAACSNIVSMLILLVNDKKKEIATLRSMGASSKSIALIFGFSGFVMGLISSIIGIAFAILTLHHLDVLINILSIIQGHDFFNAAFFGNKLPSELSYSALLFVLITTPIFALIAGLVPAIKAARIHPSHILRSE